MSEAWEVTDSEVVWEGYSTVRVDTVRMPDGSTGEREVVEHGPAAAVVAVTDAGEVALVRQYRHAFGRYLLEIPAGGLDDGDDHAREAAQRELAEEVGFSADELVHLTTIQTSVGWTTEVCHVLLGRGLRRAEPPEDFEATGEEADMEVVLLPLEEAVAAVHEGTITDAKTVVGLLLAAERLA
jgi:8-oxo-dGTP pyrophosphatase MutT (NUDIX family)